MSDFAIHLLAATAVEQQEAITNDNVPIKISAVIWRKTIDPKRTVIEVVNVGDSVVQVAQTALRNVIGQHTLDDVLQGAGGDIEGTAKLDR